MYLIFISQLKIICAFYSYIANPNDNLDGWSILNAHSPYLTNCAGITILGGITSFNENTMIINKVKNQIIVEALEIQILIIRQN